METYILIAIVMRSVYAVAYMHCTWTSAFPITRPPLTQQNAHIRFILNLIVLAWGIWLVNNN